MLPGQSPETIDTRLIFRVYAWIAGLGAFSALAAAVLIARSAVPSRPVSLMLGMVGAISFLLASQAAAFSTLDDPAARLRGLKQFAIAHLAAGAFLWLLAYTLVLPRGQLDAMAVFALSPYHLIAPNLLITAAVLFYLAYTASPWPRFTATVRSTTYDAAGRPRAFALREKEGAASTRRLRSQYEEQIRQAAKQEERARLARELHDAVKQQLFVIQAAAATVQARFDTDVPGAKQAVEHVRTAAREAMTEMEAMLDQLQAAPVENVGLVEALKRQCEALGFRTGVEVTVDIQPLPPTALLPPGAQQAIFRVAQEALANISRHARACRVTVRLAARNDSLVLDVVDDGAGFDPMSGRSGMGIANMQARAADVGGRFDLASSPGAGTTVSFAIPFTARSPRAYLLMTVAFASALVVSGILVAQGGGNLRPVWLAAGWIAAIGTARYLVALYRVRRPAAEAA